jgi:hypothetical protein
MSKRQWTINGRFSFDGHAVVEASTEQEALLKFEAGDFEFNHPTASMVDWDRRGKAVDTDKT